VRKREDVDVYQPDHPHYQEKLDELLERSTYSLEDDDRAKEEEEVATVRRFAAREPSPGTEQSLVRMSTKIWPAIAYERGQHFRGDFVKAPNLDWLDKKEIGAIECRTTIEDRRIRTDPNPKEDDPEEKVITFCFFLNFAAFLDCISFRFCRIGNSKRFFCHFVKMFLKTNEK
jgi:hypothetical protein